LGEKDRPGEPAGWRTASKMEPVAAGIRFRGCGMMKGLATLGWLDSKIEWRGGGGLGAGAWGRKLGLPRWRRDPHLRLGVAVCGAIQRGRCLLSRAGRHGSGKDQVRKGDFLIGDGIGDSTFRHRSSRSLVGGGWWRLPGLGLRPVALLAAQRGRLLLLPSFCSTCCPLSSRSEQN
jgi:hypothetical protein